MLPSPSPLRRLFFLLAAPLLLARVASLHAAPPEDPFLRDYAETRGFMLGRPVNATPTPDGTAVIFLRAKSAREPSQELYEFNVASGQTRRLLAPEDALQGAAEKLSPEEKARRERQRISVGGFTAFSIAKDSAMVLLSLSGKLYVLNRADGGVRELATGAGTIVDPKFSPDSRSVAYVRGCDVYVFDLATGKERAVTTGGTETVSHGLAEFVAQEEMARYAGFWWSPDSRQIAYQESDASKVETWYPADPAQPGNPPQPVFYPRPGKENVSVRVGVVPVDGSGKTVWLDYDRAKYSYLGKVTWKEEGPLTLTVLSRDQRDLALLKADPETGKTSVLLTEHNDAWVNLGQDVPRMAFRAGRRRFSLGDVRRGLANGPSSTAQSRWRYGHTDTAFHALGSKDGFPHARRSGWRDGPTVYIEWINADYSTPAARCELDWASAESSDRLCRRWLSEPRAGSQA